jgi:hypothetical protein
MTVDQLIRISDQVHVMKPEFSLSSAIVNDYILAHTLKSRQDIVTGLLDESVLGSEIVSFVVLQTPSINITTGAPALYSLIGEARANHVVVAAGANLLLYRTFQAIWQGKQKHQIDYPYQGPLTKVRPPANERDLIKLDDSIKQEHAMSGLEHLESSAHDYLLSTLSTNYVELQEDVSPLYFGFPLSAGTKVPTKLTDALTEFPLDLADSQDSDEESKTDSN